MIYPVYVYGHPVLRKVAEEIDEDYKDLDVLVNNMFETMYHTDGIGLAAPQIGKSIRVLVIDADPMKEEYPELEGFKRVMINPIILEHNTEISSIAEGCLSLPGINEEVKRPTKITVEYETPDFELVEEELEGFAARVVQHEYDHLEGKLFIDHVSPLRRRFIKGKLNSIAKGKANVRYKIVIA